MRKPIDIGDGYSAASLLPSGEWLAVVRPHAVHGMVELTGAAPFDESSRGDQPAVRRYRASLTRAETAFLVPSVSSGTLDIERGADEDGALWERLCLEVPESSDRIELDLVFRGRLQRPPYAEITDTAPLAPLADDTTVDAVGSRLLTHSELLGADAEIVIEPDAGNDAAWVLGDNGSAAWHGSWTRPASGWTAIEVLVRCRLTTSNDPVRDASVKVTKQMPALPSDVRDVPGVAGVVSGTRSYILDCCALRTGVGESVFLTDHRLLPLSWTRDAYYMALLLLICADDRSLAALSQHLRWLWGPAWASGAWMRSHLTNGAVKDPGLQADQQLYPVLELVGYRRAAGAWPELAVGIESWGSAVTAALEALPISPESALLESEENPADDASDYPFSFSTQILYIHVLEQLIELSGELELDAATLRKTALTVRASVTRHFIVDGPDGTLFAYEADGKGGSRLYGDANDLPTALAPAWGFCSDDDEVWRRTMRFILSARNSGWSDGPFGGLGSAHTPGTWPLGDLQAYLFHRRIGENDEAERMRDRMLAVVSPDGLLPETIDSKTGDWSARHWFAWPSAAWASALIEPAMSAR